MLSCFREALCCVCGQAAGVKQWQWQWQQPLQRAACSGRGVRDSGGSGGSSGSGVTVAAA